MKSLIIYFLFSLPLVLAAQPQADSLMARQLRLQKQQLNLSDAQFAQYKKAAADYRDKMGKLTAQISDTAIFVARSKAIRQRYKSDLKKILTEAQWNQYKAAEQSAWQRFEKKAEEDHIKVNGKAKD